MPLCILHCYVGTEEAFVLKVERADDVGIEALFDDRVSEQLLNLLHGDINPM
jgi:hypothetical protein